MEGFDSRSRAAQAASGAVGMGEGGDGRLRPAYALLDELVNGSPEALVALSAAGAILFWNRGAEALYGFSAAEAESRSLLPLVVPSDRQAETRDAFEQALRTGHANGESVRCRRDGTRLPVEVLFTCIRDPRGEVAFVALSERDISIRMRAYDALRRLSSIVEYSDDAIISETLDGIILSWNAGATRLYGYEAEEVIGRPITLLAPEERDHEPFELLQRIRRGERVEHYNTVRRRKDGTCLDVSATISPIRDGTGAVAGASLIARDITEEMRLRRQLDEIGRQRAEDLRRFVSSVQKAQEEERGRISRELHDDIGQRLTGLKLRLEVLEDEIAGASPAGASSLSGVTREIEAMMAEVKRISSNLHPAELDDFGLVSALNLLCRDFGKSCGITVTFQQGPAMPYGKDIEIALYRIAQEGLANIAHHAGAGSVLVRLAHLQGVVSLLIEDDGRGFDAARLRAHGGLHAGLGLISMKERAQLFGGSMYLTSAPGQGTRIHVEIPLPKGGGA
ncbi:MAG TPA: PAS domain S-box protein [Bacteroidota bacterium]|nr:PAS domain S-box protein [Bacteroidota bacterium]